MRERDFHKKKAVKNNSNMHWIKFRAIRNKVNSELKKAKKNYFCNKIKDCVRVKDPKQSWKLINNLLGKNNKSNNISQLKVEDVIISDDIKIAESFNDFFVNIGAKLANEIEINSTDFTSLQSVPSRPDIQFKFSEISTHEVCLQLRNLKTSKST
ncbi:Hypothetical predicted protein, partial [Paramuricea clavata]